MLQVECLPAQRGDCIFVEWGTGAKVHRLLVDAGPQVTFANVERRLRAVPEKERSLELFVVTHVDDDHIGGSLTLLSKLGDLGLSFADVWFNGREQLDPTLSAIQGERLTKAIVGSKLAHNVAFSKGARTGFDRAVVLPDAGKLPRVALADGLVLTLLSPTRAKLDELRPVWEEEVKKHGLLGDAATLEGELPVDQLLGALDVDALAERPTRKDPSKPNGSSIAVLLEYGDVSCILGADAHAEVLEASLRRLLAERKLARLPLDLFKLPHHGSKNNVSRALLDLVDCTEYLVSSNGAQFQHPDAECIAKVLKFGKPSKGGFQVHFNYRTKFNEMWDDAALRKKWGYEPTYPSKGKEGVALRWEAQ